MGQHCVQTISRQELEIRLDRRQPYNLDTRCGFALVNVAGPADFAKAHIRGSINIPHTRIDEFEDRFDKNKEIVVYCAAPDCTAARDTANALASRGFSNVRSYAGGTSDWMQAGHDVQVSQAA